MAEYTKQDIFDIITEYLETNGSAIGSGAVRELSQSELNDETLRILTIPSMMPSTEEWVQTSLHNMMRPITNATTDLTTLKMQVIQATDTANAAAGRVDDAIDDVDDAVTHAENVNATLVGMTVTITDRDGQSSSINIGFEIAPEHVYASKSAMESDAANVLSGQFCMIATTDTTDPDNATLWSRNSNPATNPSTCFTFLSDLDQASTSAWADWMNNQKPLIIDATDAANAAALLANAKANAAQTAADNANTARVAIEQNEHTRQANEQLRVAAESQRQTDWTSFFSDTLATGCRKLWNDFWSNINSLWTGFWGTSADDPNGVRKQWSDLHEALTTDHVQASSDHSRANQDHSIAESDHTTAGADHTTAEADHSTAGTDHATVQEDHLTAEADHVIAENDSTRAGQEHAIAVQDHAQAVSDNTRATLDHQTAVQDNIVAGEDHEQAAEDTTRAASDHDVAEQDHGVASSDHGVASADHTQAEADHTRAGQDHAASEQATTEAIEQTEILEEWNTHQPYIGNGTTGDENYWYIWVDGQYVRSVYAKGDDLHWEEMSEQEKQDLASRVLAQLVFATPEETRAMLNELT